MIKRVFLVGVMLSLVSLLVVGCGIPQEEHDAVQAEVVSLQSDLAKAESQIGTLESDLAKAESEVETLKSDLTDAESQIESLQSSVSAAQGQLSSFKSDLKGTWTSLDGLLKINLITLYINASILEDNLDEIYEGCLLMTVALPSLGDSGLEALWAEAYVSDGGEWNLYYTPFASFLEALAERIDSEQEALNNKL